jgi:hypothetical protein
VAAGRPCAASTHAMQCTSGVLCVCFVLQGAGKGGKRLRAGGTEPAAAAGLEVAPATATNFVPRDQVHARKLQRQWQGVPCSCQLVLRPGSCAPLGTTSCSRCSRSPYQAWRVLPSPTATSALVPPHPLAFSHKLTPPPLPVPALCRWCCRLS